MDASIQWRGTIYEKGFGMIAQKVMRDKDLDPKSKSIYAYLCSFSSTDNDPANLDRSAFPGVEIMWKELGMTENTYYKHRKPLIEKGYLIVEKRPKEKGSRFAGNLYVLPAVPVPPAQEPKEDDPETAADQGNDPHRKNYGTEKPHRKFSGMKNSGMKNSGTNITSFNITSFNNKEEEEEAAGQLINFLINQGHSKKQVQSFLKRVKKDQPPEFTFEEAAEAIDLSLADYEAGLCRYPYGYAVEKLSNMIAAKAAKKRRPAAAAKPEQKKRAKGQQTRKPIRVEKLPDWHGKPEPEKKKPLYTDREQDIMKAAMGIIPLDKIEPITEEERPFYEEHMKAHAARRERKLANRQK